MVSKYVDVTAIMQVVGNVFNNPQILDFTDKYTITEDDFPDEFHRVAFGEVKHVYQQLQLLARKGDPAKGHGRTLAVPNGIFSVGQCHANVSPFNGLAVKGSLAVQNKMQDVAVVLDHVGLVIPALLITKHHNVKAGA